MTRSGIEHVTLTTGHVRTSYRHEVAEEVIAAMRALIARLDGVNTVPIPGLPGLYLGGRVSGRCMAATVWTAGPPSECILTIGVAAHSRCGAPLWRALCRYGTGPLLVRPDRRQPPTPWVAAALEAPVTALLYAPDGPAILGRLGDFERCLAWGFLSLKEPNRPRKS